MRSKVGNWYRSTLGHALAGAALYWAALPPLDRYGCWVLAWIAPIWWILLIRSSKLPAATAPDWVPRAARQQSDNRRAGKRQPDRWRLLCRPYFVLWAVGFLFWMVALHWLRLPHWATGFGWVAMSAYLGCYLPAFIGLSRVAVHRLRIPVILAAPVVWMGLELARGHLLTGFTMASLGHTQYRWIGLIQVSDLAGAYGVGFVVMFVAASVARMLPVEDRRGAIWPLFPAAAMLLAVLLYGQARLARLDAEPRGDQPALRIALVQGSFDVVLKPAPGTNEAIHQRYLELSRQAVERFGKLDLIIWPETVYGIFLIEHAAMPATPDWWTGTPQQFRQRLASLAMDSLHHLRGTAESLGAPLLVGITRQFWGAEGPQVFNSAAFVPLDDRPIASYDKMHLVMFGEYVPLADQLAWLVKLTPLSTLGLTTKAGAKPMSFEVGNVRFSPNICYESVMPQVIGRQIRWLARQGREPHVLVNLTNDGWFWGSSELDMHLICGVFRAVESRKPLLVAANTGISAWIDCCGRILTQGPRRDEALLLAEVAPELHASWYVRYGDVPAACCAAMCILFACAGCWEQCSRLRKQRVGETAH